MAGEEKDKKPSGELTGIRKFLHENKVSLGVAAGVVITLLVQSVFSGTSEDGGAISANAASSDTGPTPETQTHTTNGVPKGFSDDRILYPMPSQIDDAQDAIGTILQRPVTDAYAKAALEAGGFRSGGVAYQITHDPTGHSFHIEKAGVGSRLYIEGPDFDKPLPEPVAKPAEVAKTEPAPTPQPETAKGSGVETAEPEGEPRVSVEGTGRVFVDEYGRLYDEVRLSNGRTVLIPRSDYAENCSSGQSAWNQNEADYYRARQDVRNDYYRGYYDYSRW